MDGQVDYLYECKDNVCVTRSEYVAGEANKMLRRTIIGDQQTFELYQKENGKFILVSSNTTTTKETDNQIGIVDHTEGQAYCTNCDDEVTAFYDKVNDLIDIQENIAPPSALTDLKKKGDFYVSRIGILIHENCAHNGRWGDKNFEEILVNSMVQGMSCLAEGQQIVDEDQEESGIDRTSTKYSIFPQLQKHLSNDSMIFCEIDDLKKKEIAVIENEEDRRRAINSPEYASIGSRGTVQYDGKTYRGSYVVLKGEQTHGMTEDELEALLFHGKMHNLGYLHANTYESIANDEAARRHFNLPSYAHGEIHPHNDYATLCEAGCFPEVYNKLLGKGAVSEAYGHCLDYNITKGAGDATYEIRIAIRNKYNY